jgi:hypothetical protein
MLCMERFRKFGWCPRQVVATSEAALGSRSVLFSLSSIDRNDALHGNHDQRSVEKCVLEYVDNDTYQPLHTSDCDNSDCPLVPEVTKPGRNDASTIIARMTRKGWILIISVIDQPGSTPLLSIKAYQPGHKRGGPMLRKLRISSPEIDPMERIVKLCDLGSKNKSANERKRTQTSTDRFGYQEKSSKSW